MDKISNLLCNYKCLRNEYTEYKAEYKAGFKMKLN